MDAPWCSKVGILVSFLVSWRLRENLGERQRDVGKRLHGNRSGPSDAADVAIAAGVGYAVDLDAFRNTVDHPVLGNPGRGVEPELGRSAVGEGAFGDLDQQERVLRVGLALLVGHPAAPDDG